MKTVMLFSGIKTKESSLLAVGSPPKGCLCGEFGKHQLLDT